MSESSGLVLTPVKARLRLVSASPAFARCDLGGDNAPRDRLTTSQLPEPRRGPDDHAKPAAADIPAVDADVDSPVSSSRHSCHRLDRPGFFRGFCLPDMINLPCFPGSRSSFPRTLSGEYTCRRSAGAQCCTSQPIPGSQA